MDNQLAFDNMIDQQIRPWNVLAMKTLKTLALIRRQDFVPPAYADLAFADISIPLACGEVMLEPKIEARMLEALDLLPTDRVLEIGTGSGYLTALMATLAQQVTSVEIHLELSQTAADNLAMAGISNVTLAIGDAHAQWSDKKYDAIIINGSLPTCPDAYLDCLSASGRLLAIVGNEPAMQVMVYRKGVDQIEATSLFETYAPRLRNVDETKSFAF